MQIADKKALRKHFKEVRINMPFTEKEKADSKIAANFLDSEDYINCKDILMYVSSEIEVSTRLVMEKALLEKRVFCPRCEDGTNIMYFYKINSFSQLEKGSFGILEPSKECEICGNFNETSVCLVPGLSFDEKGYRLGFGKGFYDRFLKNFKGIKTGLCYETCLSQNLPSDIFDITVDKLITEKNIRDFSD